MNTEFTLTQELGCENRVASAAECFNHCCIRAAFLQLGLDRINNNTADCNVVINLILFITDWLHFVFAADYLQAIQATAVLSCIFAILALFVFVAQLFTLPKGQRFTFTGILQLIACE